MLKKLLFSTIICFSIFSGIAQNRGAKYIIEFKDKNGSKYSIDKPIEFLSQKSIDRRVRQNIVVNATDLPIVEAYLNLITSLGAKVLSTSKWLNIVEIELPFKTSIETIEALSFVKSVKFISEEKNYQTPLKFPVIDNPSFKFNDGDYGKAFNQANQIGVDCMHKIGYTGKGITIALLDAGYDKMDVLPAFDRMRANGQLLGTKDFVDGDTFVYHGSNHGMAVLSTMAGYIEGEIIGTAPDANYYLIRTEDAATEYIQEEIFWAQGAEYADSLGVDIINSSLGYSIFDDSTSNHSYSDLDGNTTIITRAADMAASKGIFVVTSAGNSGGAPWYKITAPADADSILTVGAIDSAGTITGFSGKGLTFDGRIKPDVCAKGFWAIYASPWGGVAKGNGTSFSSPITAGAVACLWQANPKRTNMELMNAIKMFSDKYSFPDSVYGYGIPNFCKSNVYLQESISIDDYEKWEVYPNPFHNYFQINFYTNKDDNLRIDLLDVAGKLIASQSNDVYAYAPNIFIIDESTNLAAGVYFIRVKTQEKLIVKKIIKN